MGCWPTCKRPAAWYSVKPCCSLWSRTVSAATDAYRIVQRNALAAWDGGEQLLDLLKEDPDVTIATDELRARFSVERFLANSAIVFERLEALEIA